MKYPTVSDDPEVQAFYEDCRRRGSSHNIAEMLALKQVPGLKTDTRFGAQREHTGDQFGDFHTEKLRKEARKQGYNPKPTDTYIPTLAKTAGDPAAWVPHDNSRSHIKRVLKQRNWSASGSVERQASV